MEEVEEEDDVQGMGGAHFHHHAQDSIRTREEKESLREGRSSPRASPSDEINFHHEEM